MNTYSQSQRGGISAGATFALGLSGIIIALIIIGGMLTAREQKATKNIQRELPEDLDTSDVDASLLESGSFGDFSDGEILGLINTNGTPLLDPLSGIAVDASVDITGDGILDAVVTGNGGNHDASYILYMDTKGETTVADMKNKDGAIFPTSLMRVARVMYQNDFELLPAYNGFYTIARELTDDTSGVYSCSVDGVAAYTWNSSTELFEWSAGLTAKYTAELCS